MYLGQKRISFEEFIPIFTTQRKKVMSAGFEHFSEGFRVFDRDNNGTVSVAEIRHLLTSLGKLLHIHPYLITFIYTLCLLFMVHQYFLYFL